MSEILHEQIGRKNYAVDYVETAKGVDLDLKNARITVGPDATLRQVDKALTICQRHEFPNVALGPIQSVE